MSNFLPRKFHRFFIALMVIMLLLGKMVVLILLAFSYLIILFFLRKSKVHQLKENELSQGVLFSPVNGRILEINKNIEHEKFGANLTQLRIAIPWWSENGIYLPASLEIKDISQKSLENHFRYKKVLDEGQQLKEVGLSISLISNSCDTLGFQLIKCPFGGKPEVGVLPGDRGKARANIGYFPFGGTFLLYIPENYKIMVSLKDIVVAGVTLIAGE